MTTKETSLSTDNNNTDPEQDDHDSEGFETMSETFGTGVNQKVLLVTKGFSIKNIVKSST
tara:strand:+ start:10413 stop:10592 length:180 start_codon:yes stop_codon:yes gene_type:complete